MFPKAKWTAQARRFLNRTWQFLVQTGVTILGILHKEVRRLWSAALPMSSFLPGTRLRMSEATPRLPCRVCFAPTFRHGQLALQVTLLWSCGCGGRTDAARSKGAFKYGAPTVPVRLPAKLAGEV